jgi:hypothetical protein
MSTVALRGAVDARGFVWVVFGDAKQVRPSSTS